MVERDIVENYQSELLKGSDGDAAQRGLLMPSYAPLQSRLSGYKTYQEKTKYTETDLPAFDLGDFHIKVLNDRGPEPLTIDDIQRDSRYIRNTVMNLREHGQLSNVEPFLNEVQLYETQPDYRGTENIPTDRLRAELFLSKSDFYKAGLYVDDIGNMRTEQVSDFERRDLTWIQQENSRKRTILFDEEKTNYNTLAGAINPRTTQDSVNQAIQKYSALADQSTQDQKYQVKVKTYNEIHDDNINFQAVPDHTIPVADYSQVFISNAGQMPLNFLYASDKQSKLIKEQFEAQQDEFNGMQKKQILQYIRAQALPVQQKSAIETQQHDQQGGKSVLGRVMNKISSRIRELGGSNQKGEREDKPIHQNFELLITLKRTKKDLCNSYYNRLQCVDDQLKVLNLDSNLIYKMPHQVDQKSLADLQVIEDFLVVVREAPKQHKSLIPKDNKYLQSQSFFDHCLGVLTDKYLSNAKQIPQHLLKQNNSQYEQTQRLGLESFQGNKTQLQTRLDKVLSQFNPQNQQVIKDQKKQLLLQQKILNPTQDRIRQQKHLHLFGANQDPALLRNLVNPTYSSLKKHTDLNPNTFDYNSISGQITTFSDNSVQSGLKDAPLNATRAPLYVDQNMRFSQFKESTPYERMPGQ